MANFSIQPEKFDSGDIVSWFRQFECCSTANAWNEEKQLQVLPAFLRGPAAAYFHALPDEVKGSYRNLKEQLLATNLSRAVLPLHVCRTVHQMDFTPRHVKIQDHGTTKPVAALIVMDLGIL